MPLNPDVIWAAFTEEFPPMITTAMKAEVAQEFERRGYTTEADLARFIAGIRHDEWYTADFTDGAPVGWYGSPQFKYVNAYVTEQMYGGPEEGGWYYQAGTPIASVPVPYDAPESVTDPIIKSLMDLFGPERRDVSVWVGKEFAEYYPKQKPHYE